MLRQDERAQARFDKIETSIAKQPERWREDVEKARAELEAFVVRQLERERGLLIGRRLVGILFLLVGVPLVAVANIV